MTAAVGIGGSGYDLDFLSAYADRGRTPAVAAIDDNPECLAVLESIERLGRLQRALLIDEMAAAPPLDERWVEGLLASISREVRAGRDIDFPGDEEASVVITEGAVREAIRVAGDDVPGVLVGSVRLDRAAADDRASVPLDEQPASASLDDGTADVRVEVSVSVAVGRPVAELADRVRAAVDLAIARSTPLRATAIDIVVDDVHLPTAWGAA